jgi:uncharacterized protein YacL
MSNFEDHIKKLDIRNIAITSNITAFGIVLALLWKDVLTEALTVLVPHGTGLLFLFMTASIGTVLIVILAYFLLHLQQINRKNLYSFKERVKIRSYRPGMLRELRRYGIRNKFKYSYRSKPISFK